MKYRDDEKCAITDELIIVRNDQNLIHTFNVQ